MSKSLAALVLLCSVLGTNNAWSATPEERAQHAAEVRQGLLEVVGFYIGPIVGMAREQIPYDADVVKANAENMAALLPMIHDVFRNDTSSFELDTEALAGIWSNTEDFNAKATTAAENAAALAAATAEGQGAAMKAFGALGGSCKACHDEYRQQD